MKALNYSLFMWLPDYLSNEFGLNGEAKGFMAGSYDIGGAVGAVLSGVYSDLVADRVLVISPMILMTAPLFIVMICTTQETYWVYYLVLPLLGFLIGGVSALISTSVAADLAQTEESEEYDVKASIAGIIDGSGGLCASASQLLVNSI